MKTLTFYEVEDSYSEDGRGPSTVIARFINENDARGYARGRGNYGHDAHVKPVHITLFHTINEAEKYDENLIKSKALAKLTKEEKKVLGLE